MSPITCAFQQNRLGAFGAMLVMMVIQVAPAVKGSCLCATLLKFVCYCVLLLLLQRIAEAEEQKRLKEQQEQQKRREEQEARRAEIFAGMGSASAAGNDDAVHADVEKLLAQVPGVPRGAAPPAAGDAAADGDAMDVDAQQQQDGDDSDDGPGDGGGFD